MAQTPEAIVLRKNLTEIAELVSSHQDGPSWFADQLVAEDFVSSTDLVATGGLSPYRLVSRMLWPVEYKVKASYCDTAAEFFKLVGILEKRAAYSRLARHMVDEYSECMHEAGRLRHGISTGMHWSSLVFHLFGTVGSAVIRSATCSGNVCVLSQWTGYTGMILCGSLAGFSSRF